MKDDRIYILISRETKSKLKNALEKLRPIFKRRGQTTDFIDPAIDKFIEAANKNRAIEFIEYIKAWR